MNRPRIIYKKWWHRFIPSYRKSIKVMDDIFAWDWENGGKERLDKHRTEFMLTGKTKIGDKMFYWK